MKKMLVTFVSVLALVSCSTPKYAYYFDHHDYQAGKKKKEVPATESRVTMQEIMQAIEPLPQDVQQHDQGLAVASVRKEIYSSKATTPVTDEVAPLTISKDKKRELGRQVKSAIKDYKKQAHNNAQAAGGDKNQLIALLLAIFLGALGIHRFYLGHTGTALLQVLLFVLGLFLLFPLYALALWVLIDIILIAIGKLTPKGGSYNPEL
jgi:TM2 domain-containing membrane protein YozV